MVGQSEVEVQPELEPEPELEVEVRPEPELDVDEALFRRAIGRVATGVSVITTTSGAHDYAITVGTLTSVSLEPPMVLFCVDRDARFYEAVCECRNFGASVLPASARPAAQWFATAGRPLVGQLDRTPHHRGPRGATLLDAALATLECRVQAIHEAGDHAIVVGGVLAAGVGADNEQGLAYFRGRYVTLD